MNIILIIPLAALIITQTIKVAIDFIKHQRSQFKWRYLNYYGGMPSSHSALFSSLIMVSWLVYGWDSFQVAISVIMYLVVVRDAVGIRQHLGQHGAILKKIIEEGHTDVKYGPIVTRLGHTPLQATVGTLCGIVITLILYPLLAQL